MKYFFKTLIVFSIVLVMGNIAHAQGGDTTQGTFKGVTYECAPKVVKNVTVYGECTWADFIKEVMHIVDFGVVDVVLPLTVAVIAWAGYKYMVSGANPGERSKANWMLTKTVIGIAVIMSAWLIVHLITTELINPDVVKTSI